MGCHCGVRTSQNMRATAFWRGRQGRIRNVVGSGMATISLSSMRANPSIDEPSKPTPRSSASGSSCAVMANPLSAPRMSVNQSRMNLTSCSRTMPRTYSRASSLSAVMRALPPAKGLGKV